MPRKYFNDHFGIEVTAPTRIGIYGVITNTFRELSRPLLPPIEVDASTKTLHNSRKRVGVVYISYQHMIIFNARAIPLGEGNGWGFLLTLSSHPSTS